MLMLAMASSHHSSHLRAKKLNSVEPGKNNTNSEVNATNVRISSPFFKAHRATHVTNMFTCSRQEYEAEKQGRCIKKALKYRKYNFALS